MDIEITENISEGKMCPFLMSKVNDFHTKVEDVVCLGERCAFFQSVYESYMETDENDQPVFDSNNQPVIKTKEVQGCAVALDSKVNYSTLAAISDINRTGHFIAKGFSKMLTPVDMRQSNQGIVVARGNLPKI